MGPVLIITFQPFIEIGLKFILSRIDLLAECNTVEFIEDCLVEALSQFRLSAGSSSLFVSGRYHGRRDRAGTHDACGLPQYSVPLSVSTRHSFTSCASKKGITLSLRMSAAVIGVLRVTDLCEGDLRPGIDAGLLADTAYALDIFCVKCVLAAALSRAFTLELAMGFLFAP